ncbi:Isochorismatase-like protein [Lipomyces arxii]|uniref:Isochorismatase-like protein n=1 Tax=Lipomyces arxii TaxID=56418 RepID=UPI0034CFFF6F
MTILRIESARPSPFALPRGRTALVIIDMQRDFVLPTGYGAVQCPSAEIFAQVAGLVKPTLDALRAARKLGMTVVHTREGHEPDLGDCPPTKTDRQVNANTRHVLTIGDEGPMGRLLVRGAYGHDIVDELKPRLDEVVLDKPGKGAFYNTDLHELLVARGITHLIFCGVTAECCVASSFREANDHGFESCVLVDCTGGFNGDIVAATKAMFCAYDGLLGYSSDSRSLVEVAESESSKALSISSPMMDLHEKYIAGRKVSEVLATFARVEKRVKELDADIVVDIDGVRDLSLLYGVPFSTTPEIANDSAIVQELIALGAVLTTSTSESEALFTVTTEPSIFMNTHSVFITSGPFSTDGISLPSPSTSSIAFASHSITDARTVYATLLRTKITKQHFRERPVISVDYRGFEGGGIRYSSFKDVAFPVPSRRVADVAVEYLRKAKDLTAASESVFSIEIRGTRPSVTDTLQNMHDLSEIKTKFAHVFGSDLCEHDSADIAILPFDKTYLDTVSALNACAIVYKGEMLVAPSGFDARLLDAAISIGS